MCQEHRLGNQTSTGRTQSRTPSQPRPASRRTTAHQVKSMVCPDTACPNSAMNPCLPHSDSQHFPMPHATLQTNRLPAAETSAGTLPSSPIPCPRNSRCTHSFSQHQPPTRHSPSYNIDKMNSPEKRKPKKPPAPPRSSHATTLYCPRCRRHRICVLVGERFRCIRCDTFV